MKNMYSRSQKRIDLSKMTDEEIDKVTKSAEDEGDDSEDELSEAESEEEEFLISYYDFQQMDNYIEQLENASASNFFSTIGSLVVNHEVSVTTSKPLIYTFQNKQFLLTSFF